MDVHRLSLEFLQAVPQPCARGWREEGVASEAFGLDGANGPHARVVFGNVSPGAVLVFPIFVLFSKALSSEPSCLRFWDIAAPGSVDV